MCITIEQQSPNFLKANKGNVLVGGEHTFEINLKDYPNGCLMHGEFYLKLRTTLVTPVQELTFETGKFNAGLPRKKGLDILQEYISVLRGEKDIGIVDSIYSNTVVCKSCNKHNPLTSVFCGYCGKKIATRWSY